MTEVRYESSDGKKYDFAGDEMRVTEGGLHKYKWKINSSKLMYGDNVHGFTKDSITYTLTLSFRGLLEDRKKRMDELRNSFEYDIVNCTPGKLYFGEYYIKMYVIESNTSISSTWNHWTKDDITIYCQYPFWSRDYKKSFFQTSNTGNGAYNFLEYKYDMPFDYCEPVVGSQHWDVGHFASSNFEMIIYGSCANPRIVVNDHVYQIHDTLEDNEYIIVSSRNKTVTKHLANGTMQNIFDLREKQSSVFERIPSGNLIINWNGEFGFDIALFLERSEPLWN